MTLVAARLELHHAAQILAACADAWLPARADDGHTAMRWVSPALVGETGLALRSDLVLVHGAATYSLVGKTIAEGLAWADAQLGPPRGAKLRAYDLPASPLRSGARFVGHAEHHELAGWYDRGLAALLAVAPPDGIRVWPHHFDIGAVLTGNIGAGMSPGDRYYAEPYFYVTPAAHIAAPPAIGGGGFWRDDDWQGAVLLGSAAGDVDLFFTSAVAALTRI